MKTSGNFHFERRDDEGKGSERKGGRGKWREGRKEERIGLREKGGRVIESGKLGEKERRKEARRDEKKERNERGEGKGMAMSV